MNPGTKAGLLKVAFSAAAAIGVGAALQMMLPEPTPLVRGICAGFCVIAALTATILAVRGARLDAASEKQNEEFRQKIAAQNEQWRLLQESPDYKAFIARSSHPL